jgi:L-asparaginase / beta-aspartyl-peptidase
MTGPTRNASPRNAKSSFALAIHGGAGTLRRGLMDEPRGALYRAGLQASLAAGHDVLAAGGSALDAVSAAVLVLEDDPLFNAGRGASFTSSGTIEMDAAVMEGRERRAGAVAGICGPKNPVLAARAVMEHSPHVLLAGAGALAFCRGQGLAFAERDYFYTENRWQALQHILERRRCGLPDTDPEEDDALRHGTVGAVARDRDGNLAAATSTGGIAGKLPGRIGDSPIIGAGTWAHDDTVAVSATGTGEYFMRAVFAHSVHAHWQRTAGDLIASTELALREVQDLGGHGGCIAIDRNGRIALPFTTPDMPRAFQSEGQAPVVIVFDGV